MGGAVGGVGVWGVGAVKGWEEGVLVWVGLWRVGGRCGVWVGL